MNLKIPIIFENEYFIAVDKPSGWLSVPSRLGGADRRPCVGIELQNEKGRLFPVHRLDFEVSGIIIFAKNAQAQKDAQKWFEDHLVLKTYEAITEGDISLAQKIEPHTVWKSKLVKGKKRAFEADYGKLAETCVQFMGSSHLGLRWRLNPLTGRSHQLRFELSKHGFPILGDVLYGGQPLDKEGFIFLRSIMLSFEKCTGALNYGLPNLIQVEGF